MKQSPIKNMAYWKGKNTISPVKQEEEKKVGLDVNPEDVVIKTGPKPDPSKLVKPPDEPEPKIEYKPE